MAQKSTKLRAKANTSALKNLHTGAIIVNVAFILCHFFIRPRSLTAYFLCSIPAFFCQYTLEKAGRPKYHPTTGALVTSGDDLNAAGLTDYMFDCVWVTWASVVLVILAGNWGWLLWTIIPIFVVKNGAGLLGTMMGQFSGTRNAI